LVDLTCANVANVVGFVEGFEDGADYRALPDSLICDASGASVNESAVDGLSLNVLTFVREFGELHVRVQSPSHSGESGETVEASDESDGLLFREDDLVCHGLVGCHGTAFCHVQTLFWKRKLLSFKRQCVQLNKF
jgi:hypothetical protein